MKQLFKNCDILATENDTFRVIRNGFPALTTHIMVTRGGAHMTPNRTAGKLLAPGLSIARIRNVLLRGIDDCRCRVAV